MMDAALSSSAPADADTVPMPDRSRGLGADSGPIPSPDASDTETSTAEEALLAFYTPSQIPEKPSTTSSASPPTSEVPRPAPQLTATDGPPSPVQSPPQGASVPLPPSPVEARDLRQGRKAQHDVDAGSATKVASLCPTCKGGKRNLVVCIDGTSNQFSTKNTNVVELYSRLIKNNDRQVTFYNSGIGTYARPSWRSFSYCKQVIANKLDLILALRLEKIILGSYQWLADNYEEGDHIFLFGFSRGAYQVRALSAMIDRVGLIHKGNADQIPFAYELYSQEDAEGNLLLNFVLGVLERIIVFALYDLVFHQHVWVAWQTAGTSTIMKRIAVWIVITHSFLQWIWNVGRNDTPETNSQTLAVDHDDPQALVAGHVAVTIPPVGDPAGEAAKERQKAVREMQGRFKSAFSRDVKVHFVGTWDTVSSVGLIRGRTLPGTTDGMQHVCYFRHALALHERRVKFLPEFVHGGIGPLKVTGYYDHSEEIRDTVMHAMHEIALGGNDPRTLDALLAVATALSAIASAFLEKLFPAAITPTELTSVEKRDPPHTKEVWFHGSHSDIGGGSSPNERMEKFGPALRWMSFEARVAGLLISKEPRLWDTELVRTSSLSPFWRLLELLPFTRLAYNGPSGTTNRPHLSSKRRVQPGQLVYGGMSERVKAKLCGAGLKIEHDPYLGAEDLLNQLRHHVNLKERLRGEDRAKIDALSSSVHGQQQLRDMKEDISVALTDLLGYYKDHQGDEPLDTQDILTMQRLLYGLEYSFDAMVNSRPLYEILGSSSAHGAWALPRPVKLHRAGIASLLYLSRPEERIISCDWDGSRKTWDMSTGKPVGTSEGSFNIWAISPDGQYGLNAHYGDYGDTLEVLDLDSGDVYARLADPPDASSGTTCSPDFRLVACGFETGIMLWDIPDRDHLIRNTTTTTISTTLSSGRAVFALAFSSKGEYLAAGLDAAIQIWDMNRRDTSVGDLLGHTHWVRSVMFSPDDEHLVSASYDGTVRIWCVAARNVLHVLSGHLSGVRTVAYSPSGKYVASGSLDLSVRIWDTTTGKLVGVPLNGHTSPVGRVIFSGDGTRVISGAKDGTIRIWARMPAVPFGGEDIPAPFPVPVLMPALEPVSQPEVEADGSSVTSLDAVGEADAEDAGPAANFELTTDSDGADARVAESGDEGDHPVAIRSHVTSGPGVEGSEGTPGLQASRTDGSTHGALTPTEDDDSVAPQTQTAAATAAVGPEAAASEDVPAACSAPRLGDPVLGAHRSEDHESPEECGARAAALGEASGTTGMDAGPEDAPDALPTPSAAGLEEPATGARETTPNRDSRAAGDTQDVAAPGLEITPTAHAATCGSSSAKTVGAARGTDPSGSSESRGTRGAGESQGPESLVGEDEQDADVAPAAHAAEPEGPAPEPVAGATETSPGAGTPEARSSAVRGR